MIKFPSHIKPARLTVSLIRIDETIRSPVTNIQQVISRGNPVWQWTYEYVDLTDSERDIAQAFLLKCRGSLNTFRITDPGDYEIRGSLSNWIDIFSGYGAFNVVAGSDTDAVNSWFAGSANFDHHITEEQKVRFEWRNKIASSNLGWKGHSAVRQVNSFSPGLSYIQRIKNFNGPSNRLVSLAVGFPGSGNYFIQSAPVTQVQSTGIISAPFIASVNTHSISIVDWNAGGEFIGDYFELSDYRLVRCALISNSENLLTRSNEFDHADWDSINANVESGFGDASPTGVTSGAWKYFVDTSINTNHLINQSITKITTQDIYNVCYYARESELDQIQIQIDDGAGANGCSAKFNLNTGVSNNITNIGVGIRAQASLFDVGSGWHRCNVSCVVSSLNTIRSRIYLLNAGGNIAFTGNGSDGIEIFGAQLRKFPFMGQYVPTVATAVVGTDWQTGSKLYVDGFDPENIIKTGQRFEIINRYHNDTNDVFERSEFKRITKEIKVHREGWVVLEFDPPIRNAPVPDRSWAQQDHLGETMHNAIIFHQPEMKARLVNGTIQYPDAPLKSMNLTFDVIEDMTE